MSIYFTQPSDLLTGTLAKAADVNSRATATNSGFNAVQADTFAAIKFPEVQSTSIYLPVIATRANTILGFDSAGNVATYANATALGAPATAQASVAFVTAAIAAAGTLTGLTSVTPSPNTIPLTNTVGTLNPLFMGQLSQFALLNFVGA